MTDRSFVEAIIEQAKPTFHTGDGGLIFANQKFFPVLPPVPQPLQVHTLNAIVEYCKRELASDKKYIVNVVDPGQVTVNSVIDLQTRQRECLLSSKLISDKFSFDTPLNVEHFIIAMQAQFVQDDTTAAILNLVGNIVSETKVATEDDGVTQRVTAKAGIVKTEERQVPNPVVLRPYRTFMEIEQPASEFVLRIKSQGPTAALYEADGGAWKNKAVADIANFLKYELAEVQNITILA